MVVSFVGLGGVRLINVGGGDCSRILVDLVVLRKSGVDGRMRFGVVIVSSSAARAPFKA